MYTKGFTIRIGPHNSYVIILYVWRPYLKRRLRLRLIYSFTSVINGESQFRTNSRTTMPIIFSANNSFTYELLWIMNSGVVGNFLLWER